MKFLYPVSRQFPFDDVCEKIVRELEKRNWQVPGIDVEIDEYGGGEQLFCCVRTVKSCNFKLYFLRKQGTMGEWNDTAAISTITIPGKELKVYNDDSLIMFYLYVGDDWDRDKEKFTDGFKTNSKLYGKPKTYLCYRGCCPCHGALELPHTHPGQRPRLLVHTNDLGRDYDPEGDEPKTFRTNKVMEEFRVYLEDVVLEMITSCSLSEFELD